jgi:hypothetical protein
MFRKKNSLVLSLLLVVSLLLPGCIEETAGPIDANFGNPSDECRKANLADPGYETDLRPQGYDRQADALLVLGIGTLHLTSVISDSATSTEVTRTWTIDVPVSEINNATYITMGSYRDTLVDVTICSGFNVVVFENMIDQNGDLSGWALMIEHPGEVREVDPGDYDGFGSVHGMIEAAADLNLETVAPNP